MRANVVSGLKPCCAPTWFQDWSPVAGQRVQPQPPVRSARPQTPPPACTFACMTLAPHPPPSNLRRPPYAPPTTEPHDPYATKQTSRRPKYRLRALLEGTSMAPRCCTHTVPSQLYKYADKLSQRRASNLESASMKSTQGMALGLPSSLNAESRRSSALPLAWSSRFRG